MNLTATASLGSLAALLALAGCGQPNVFDPPPPPTVTVQAPIQREVQLYADYVGRTDASETVEVRARVTGFLESIEFKPSDIVEKDQLLFKIEPESFEAAVASAEAELAQHVAARELAEATLKRAEVAYSKGAVSDIEMMERQAQLDAAAAMERRSAAALENANLDLSYTKIRAPIDGRVSRDYVTIGNLVGANEATLLTTIVRDHPIFAYFNINERELLPYLELRRYDVQQERQVVPARLQLSDGRDYEHEGRIDFADNRVDALTGTIQVRAEFPNPVGGLIPGLFVRVLLPEEKKQVTLVPEIALQRDLAGSYLLVVNSDNIVERLDVTLGRRLAELRIIESGLDGSERVITKGLQRARAEMTVVPKEEA